MAATVLLVFLASASSSRCGERSGKQLRYVKGDALEDDSDCVGPDGRPYPM